MAQAKVTITATDNLSKGLNSSKRKLSDFEQFTQGVGEKLEKAFSIAGIIALAVKAVTALTSAMKECVEAYSEAEKVTLRLEAVWANVGKTTNKGAIDIENYAESIEKVTYFSGEAVKEASLLLAATESLTEEGFQRALDASIDLAAALGEDVSSAASTLAKAMEDPEAALSRLKTIGVTFTDEEKEKIKALADANQQYEAQSLILEKIEQKYKGVAHAINNTPAGKLDNIKDALQDIRENLGGALLNTIQPALEQLYNTLLVISEWSATWTGSSAEILKKVEVQYHLIGGVEYPDENPDLSSYGDMELLVALDAAQKQASANWKIADGEGGAWGGLLNWLTGGHGEQSAKVFAMNSSIQYHRAYTAIEKELQSRGYASVADAKLGKKTLGEYAVQEPSTTYNSPSSSSTYDVVETVTENVESAIASFLKSYGNSSASYQKAAYEAVIAQAEDLRSQMFHWFDNPTNGVPGNYYDKDVRLSWGIETLDEFKAIYGQLGEVIDTYNGKIEDLVPKEAVEPSELETILEDYGKSYSTKYQINELEKQLESVKAVYDSADDVQKAYLDEIITGIGKEIEGLKGNGNLVVEILSFTQQMAESIGSWAGKLVGATDEQSSAFGGAVMSSLMNNLGEAGNLIGNLAQNMVAMGPVLGAIATALEYVIQGLAQAIGPILNEFVHGGIEPLMEIGRVIGEILLPIMQDIMPLVESSANFIIGLVDTLGSVFGPIISLISSVLTPVITLLCIAFNTLEPIITLLAKGLTYVTGLFEWAAQGIRHIMAMFVNWLASIDLWGWRPFENLRMNDPGSPGNLGEFIDIKLAELDEAWNSYRADYGTSTDAAVSSASYRGATHVTINIYQEAPVVGDGGMKQFAHMIRQEFDELSYYGVTT